MLLSLDFKLVGQIIGKHVRKTENFIKRKLTLTRMSEQVNEYHSRGAFIVLEGCDRAGKTTQCKQLVKKLNDSGCKAVYMNFPDRSTACGALINSYLINQQELSDQSVHLLFTLNRWEAKNKMRKLLQEGTTLIVDRYSYSGVAFSAAKGLDFEWCKAPEKGLLKPDLVIFLYLKAQELKSRGGFGDERYEEEEFQKKVTEIYHRLKDNAYWQEIDAGKSECDVLDEIYPHVVREIKEAKNKPLETLQEF